MLSELLRVLNSVLDLGGSARGRAFEDLLERYLFAQRFFVYRNPGSARPRQTDLFARDKSQDYLIEAKAQNSKLSSAVIDDARMRLGRLPQDVVACVFSLSSFTPEAIRETELNHQREILLFSPLELYELLSGSIDIRSLISKKRSSLRIEGKACFYTRRKSKRSRSGRVHFPVPELSFHIDGKPTHTSYCGSSDHNMVAFVPALPDEGWTGLFGMPIGIRYRLDTLRTFDDLRDVLATIHNLFGISSESTFSITQTNHFWAGLGAAEFMKQVAAWQSRYEAASVANPHHSEELILFSEYNSGYFALVSRQRVIVPSKPWEQEAFIFGADLEFRLPGIPLDPAPFIEFGKLARHPEDYFSVLEHRSFDHEWLKDRIVVEPIAPMVSVAEGDSPPMVKGLIVRNPFLDSQQPLPTGRSTHSPLRYLATTDYLICDLGQWHCLGDVVDKYYIKRAEAVTIGSHTVFKVLCDWGDLVKCVRQREKPTRGFKFSDYEKDERRLLSRLRR